MTAEPRVGARCATHPARLAVDACPVCGRGRCAPDRAGYAERGCGVCVVQSGAAHPPSTAEVAVRAGVAALATAIAGGWIVTQHVNVHLMSLFAPALLGLAVCWMATAAGGPRTRDQRLLVLAIAGVAAIVGTALGFRLFGQPLTPMHPGHQVGPPYLAALVGVLAWPLIGGTQPKGTRSNR